MKVEEYKLKVFQNFNRQHRWLRDNRLQIFNNNRYIYVNHMEYIWNIY